MALMIRVEILVAIVAIVFLDSHDDYDDDPHLLRVEIQITTTPHSPGDVGAIQQHDPSGHDRIVCRNYRHPFQLQKQKQKIWCLARMIQSS